MTATRSWGLSEGSRASQYLLHTFRGAADAVVVVPPTTRPVDSVANDTRSAAGADLAAFRAKARGAFGAREVFR
ncbi:hypothetical protein RB201_28095 [Streptomyces sp. S1A(2023)]